MSRPLHQIFISYSSKDIVACEAIRDELEKSGVRCWMAPRDILPGDAYASSIIDAIEKAKIFLIFVTAHSNSSQQVQKEVDRGVNAKLKIMAVMLEKVELSKALNYYLCDSHWIDGVSDKKKAIALLKESIQLHLSQAGDAPPPLPATNEFASQAQWQKKFLLPALLLAIFFCGIGATLFFRPDLIQQMTNLLPRPASKLDIRPLPLNALGSWSERFGKRALYYREPAFQWLQPAFPYLFTREELMKKSIPELDRLFEEMKARQGFIFDDPVLQQHFNQQSWYRPIKSNRPMMEINDLIENQYPVMDEENRTLIAKVIHEKTLQHLLQGGGEFNNIHLKIFPMIYYDIPAAKLTSVQGDLEGLAFGYTQNIIDMIMFQHKIPALSGPEDLNEIDIKNPWEWYRPHTAPYLIYLSFTEADGDGIKIYHADNSQSKAAAEYIIEAFGHFLAEEKNVYPWKIMLAGNHEILNHNKDGVSLLIHVIAPSDMNEFSQFDVAGKMLQESIIQLILSQYKKTKVDQ